MTEKADIRKAQTFMKVAKHPVICNSQFWPTLPPSARTLEELGRIPNERLRKLIDDGTIHPGMTREDARALRYARPQDKSPLRAGKSKRITSKARKRELPLAPQIAGLINVCIVLGGADCVRAHSDRLENLPEVPAAQEFDRWVQWAKERLAERRGR